MRVLIAPDCFTGTLTSAEAATAIAAGWQRRCADQVDLAPLSDGGPGFLDAMATSLPGRREPVVVPGPFGEPVVADMLLVDDDEAGRTAYLESAQVIGLHLVPPALRDPWTASTAGIADLLKAAVHAGANRIVIGLGGSGTSDAGEGLLVAMGEYRDLQGIELLVATDVDSPLLGPRGAAQGFARQKFAVPDRVLDVELADMEARHAQVAATWGRTPEGRDPSVALGAGAAGGLGFALLWLGGRRVPGIDTVMVAVRLSERVSASDLVVTGEGSLDWQSLRGKVVSGVATEALRAGRPAIALAGRVEVGRRELTGIGLAAAFSVVDHCGSVEAAMAAPADRLADLAERAAGTWGGM